LPPAGAVCSTATFLGSLGSHVGRYLHALKQQYRCQIICFSERNNSRCGAVHGSSWDGQVQGNSCKKARGSICFVPRRGGHQARCSWHYLVARLGHIEQDPAIPRKPFAGDGKVVPARPGNAWHGIGTLIQQ
jgi:hypothetical protein